MKITVDNVKAVTTWTTGVVVGTIIHNIVKANCDVEDREVLALNASAAAGGFVAGIAKPYTDAMVDAVHIKRKTRSLKML